MGYGGSECVAGCRAVLFGAALHVFAAAISSARSPEALLEKGTKSSLRLVQ